MQMSGWVLAQRMWKSNSIHAHCTVNHCEHLNEHYNYQSDSGS